MINWKMKANAIIDRSFAFAIRVVRLCGHLAENRREHVMSRQLLRSGTAIGALVREAQHAESKADFAHKLAISQKEANEAAYWLELLHATEYLTEAEFASVIADCRELQRLLASILISSKKNL